MGVTADNYRAANEAANNGKERKDLYTGAWDGDVYKGETTSEVPPGVRCRESPKRHADGRVTQGAASTCLHC